MNSLHSSLIVNKIWIFVLNSNWQHEQIIIVKEFTLQYDT